MHRMTITRSVLPPMRSITMRSHSARAAIRAHLKLNIRSARRRRWIKAKTTAIAIRARNRSHAVTVAKSIAGSQHCVGTRMSNAAERHHRTNAPIASIRPSNAAISVFMCASIILNYRNWNRDAKSTIKNPDHRRRWALFYRNFHFFFSIFQFCRKKRLKRDFFFSLNLVLKRTSLDSLHVRYIIHRE